MVKATQQIEPQTDHVLSCSHLPQPLGNCVREHTARMPAMKACTPAVYIPPPGPPPPAHTKRHCFVAAARGFGLYGSQRRCGRQAVKMAPNMPGKPSGMVGVVAVGQQA